MTEVTEKTNGQYIDEILALPNNTLSKTKLGKMRKDELEIHLYTLQDELETKTNDVAEEPAVEEVKEVVEPEVTTVTKLKFPERPTTGTIVQLSIAREYVFVNRGRKVKITNLGMGILYYSTHLVSTNGTSPQLVMGESVVLEGTDSVVVISNSQPEVHFELV